MNFRNLIPISMRNRLNRMLGRDRRIASRDFLWDFARYWNHSGRANPEARDALLAKIIMTYHVLEKGLTMPARRLGFGKDVVQRLMSFVDEYVGRYGLDNWQVRHAVGVLKEYRELHLTMRYSFPSEEDEYWRTLATFLSKHPDITASHQIHITRDDFFALTNSPFPEFAKSRHMVRNYALEELPTERVIDAVKIALSAPSACNRQYTRCHCLSDKRICQALLSLQRGNRGFGPLASKVLVITVDREGIDSTGERNDIYTNGGMFLMNLCYALHYCNVAHCVLNWSRSADDDDAARSIIGNHLKKSETIVALLSCGIAPDEFDVAMSPRKELAEVLVIHE